MRARGLAGHDAAFTRPRSVVRTRPSPFLGRNDSELQNCIRGWVLIREQLRCDRGSNPLEPTSCCEQLREQQVCGTRAVRKRRHAHSNAGTSRRSSSPPETELSATDLESETSDGDSKQQCFDHPRDRFRCRPRAGFRVRTGSGRRSQCLSRATFSRIWPRRPSPDPGWRAA